LNSSYYRAKVSYSLIFKDSALKEWKKLDSTIKSLFKKSLQSDWKTQGCKAQN